MKKFASFFLALLLVGMVFSCRKDNASKQEGPMEGDTHFEMQRTHTDTLATLYLTKKYLNFLQENQLDSAMSMLYEAKGDTVVPMSDENKAKVLEQLKQFPVLSYEIDRLEMRKEDDTQVYYTITWFEKEDDNPMQNTLQCVINPLRYGYYWYLTIPDYNRRNMDITPDPEK